MDSRIIEVTAAAQRHGNLNIASCGQAFFPTDVYGAPSGDSGKGVPIRLKAKGLARIIETDIPTHPTGKPRWLFRERAWVREFVRCNSLIPGDKVQIRRVSDRTYELIPQLRALTFVDLFAGIGGMRIGLERIGGNCVFSCEWDKHAQKTYEAWFGDVPTGDIRQLKANEIPDHDVLAAGFPCQPFSIAGVSKKKSLGREHGFKDVTQGTLFFHLATLIEVKRPHGLLLENVKNLLSHDKGQTWQVIESTLEELDYWLFHKVIDAGSWVPQHRERVFIVCFDKRVFHDRPPFTFPEPPTQKRKLVDILDESVPEKYTLSDHLWRYLQTYAMRHREKGNGFGFGLADLDGVTRTLSARYYKDGSEILVPQEGSNPRRLTPREAARLMGFPDDKPIVVSDTQAYRQFGNAVVPSVVEAVGREIAKVLSVHLHREGNACLLNGRGDSITTRGSYSHVVSSGRASG